MAMASASGGDWTDGDVIRLQYGRCSDSDDVCVDSDDVMTAMTCDRRPRDSPLFACESPGGVPEIVEASALGSQVGTLRPNTASYEARGVRAS